MKKAENLAGEQKIPSILLMLDQSLLGNNSILRQVWETARRLSDLEISCRVAVPVSMGSEDELPAIINRLRELSGLSIYLLLGLDGVVRYMYAKNDIDIYMHVGEYLLFRKIEEKDVWFEANQKAKREDIVKRKKKLLRTARSIFKLGVYPVENVNWPYPEYKMELSVNTYFLANIIKRVLDTIENRSLSELFRDNVKEKLVKKALQDYYLDVKRTVEILGEIDSRAAEVLRIAGRGVDVQGLDEDAMMLV
ncbi:MAG: hypothetical protein GXO26_01670 [Crenarchaeota archaeon]|nr:hypothetical protein [Thermoproteota archaeon]